MTEQYHIHLVSDSTGGTVNGILKACLAQFKGVQPMEHTWNLIRNDRQLKQVILGITKNPGPVLFTLVDPILSEYLKKTCDNMGLPATALLQPVLGMFGEYFDMESRKEPGLQHKLNAEYFSRMDAVDYALHHDDGQKTARSLSEADVILVGVSRTSKTPTCIYLANRGVKAANIPYIPNIPLPKKIYELSDTLIVGLTESPQRLVEIRKNRLQQLGGNSITDYLKIDKVTEEVKEARNLYTRMEWPIIDVTRRSIEETAAEILSILSKRRDNISDDPF